MATASDESAPKRPVTRDSIQVIQAGFIPMTIDDLTTGFHQLSIRVLREEEFTQGIHGAVDINAQLLAEVMARV